MGGMHQHAAADGGCRAVGYHTKRSEKKGTRFYPLRSILGVGLRFAGTRRVRLLVWR